MARRANNTGGGGGSVTYGTTAGTAAQGNDARIVAASGVWSADVVPTSPSANDDEFSGANGSSVSNIWTPWNFGGSINTPLINGRGALELAQTTHAGNNVQGYVQALPNAECAFAMKFGAICTNAATFIAGLVVGVDLINLPQNQFVFHQQQWGAATGSRLAASSRYGSNSSFTANDGVTSPGPACAQYFRMRVNGNVVSSDISEDGQVWWQIASITWGFTPVTMGFAVNNQATGATQRGYFEWFRLLGSGAGSSAINATFTGGYL